MYCLENICFIKLNQFSCFNFLLKHTKLRMTFGYHLTNAKYYSGEIFFAADLTKNSCRVLRYSSTPPVVLHSFLARLLQNCNSAVFHRF